MAGAALLRLQNELHSCGFYDLANTVGLVADHAVNLFRLSDGLGCCNNVEEERPPADLVEDLGPLAFEASAFTGSHDHDGKVWSIHSEPIFSRPRFLYPCCLRGI